MFLRVLRGELNSGASVSKAGRKWLKRNWSDSDCVRAQDIPYDAANSVKDKIDNVYSKTEVNNLLSGAGGGMSIWQMEMLSYE